MHGPHHDLRTLRRALLGVRSCRWLGLSIGALALVSACGSDATGSKQNAGGSGGVNATGDNPTTSNGGVSSSSGSGGTNVATGGSNASASGGVGGAIATGGQSTSSGGAPASGSGGSATASGGSAASDAGSSDAATGAEGCTRALLTSTVDSYFTALAAHDPTTVSLASNVKLTENGKAMTVGDGLWKTAGAVKFKRSALDAVSCNSVTESVLPEGTTDRIFGLRLALVDRKITEIETIVVRDGDYILNNPAGLAASVSDDWETALPVDQQPNRDDLQGFMDTYFEHFPAGACNFASDCMRLEDGGSVGACEDGAIVTCNPNATSGAASMKARLHVLDTVAGISVGFTMFAGTYTDFHMFKVRGGMVHGVHACLAAASSSGWD